MATNSMVPYSNKVGNNQTTPGAGGGMPAPVAIPGTPGAASTSNPLIPSNLTPGSANPSGGNVSPMGTTAAPSGQESVPGSPSSGSSLVTTAQDGSQNALQKQLTDIYGQGVGSELMTLLGGMGSTNSASFQQFMASMAPEEASQRASLNTQLGNMGVSGNSTVAADANADLTSQFNAQAAGFNANLIQTQLQDTIGIVTGTEQSAQQEVASSGWDVFGQVMQSLGELGGQVTQAAGKAGGFSELFG